MTQPKPLVEAARVRFSGLSAESYEEPQIGDQRVYTVLATCTAITEQDMKSEGTRRTATMKVDRIMEGVDHSIEDEAKPEPTLFDGPSDGPVAADDDGEPESVGSIMSGLAFDGGPAFSGADQ